MAQIIGWIVGVFIGSVLGALLLQLATKAVAKFNLLYSTAFVAALVGIVITNLLSLAVEFVYSIFDHEINFIGYSFVLICSFVFYSWLLGSMVTHPQLGRIGFKIGSRISFLYYVFGTAIYILTIILFKFTAQH